MSEPTMTPEPPEGPPTMGDLGRAIGRYTESEGGDSADTLNAHRGLFAIYDRWVDAGRPEHSAFMLTDEQEHAILARRIHDEAIVQRAVEAALLEQHVPAPAEPESVKDFAERAGSCCVGNMPPLLLTRPEGDTFTCSTCGQRWEWVIEESDGAWWEPVDEPAAVPAPAEAIAVLGEVVDWFGVPDWSGPPLPEDLGRRIARVLEPAVPAVSVPPVEPQVKDDAPIVENGEAEINPSVPPVEVGRLAVFRQEVPARYEVVEIIDGWARLTQDNFHAGWHRLDRLSDAGPKPEAET